MATVYSNKLSDLLPPGPTAEEGQFVTINTRRASKTGRVSQKPKVTLQEVKTVEKTIDVSVL